MQDSRKSRRQHDPGLQPERTSLAWFRTLLGYSALMALALKHNWHQAGSLFWVSVGVLILVAAILWHYTRTPATVTLWMSVRMILRNLARFVTNF